jgi:hypothetical protein
MTTRAPHPADRPRQKTPVPVPSPEPLTATPWPNRLGWNVETAAGALRFEVWPSGSICRCIDDPTSLCGFESTHYIELGADAVRGLDGPAVAALALATWTTRRKEWKTCYAVEPGDRDDVTTPT